MMTTPIEPKCEDLEDPMFCDRFKAQHSPPELGGELKTSADDKKTVYQTKYGSIEIQHFPFRIILKDAQGKVMTQSRHIIDNDSTQVKLLPFSFIKRGSDNSRSVNPVFLL